MSFVCIIKSQFANLYSVHNALKALGADVEITDSPEEIAQSKSIIFPGVGSFERVKEELDQKNLMPIIKDIAKSGKPFLGICLGMQLLFEKSHEGEKPCLGLGLLEGEVLPIPAQIVSRVPHIGWNSLEQQKGDPISKDIKNLSQVYFVHSYYCSPQAPEQILAFTEVDGFKIPAIVKKNNIYGMQFHPERSGPIGLKLLENFLKV